jgi:RNA polymerase sigma-70 factor (ECF subfamily)
MDKCMSRKRKLKKERKQLRIPEGHYIKFDYNKIQRLAKENGLQVYLKANDSVLEIKSKINTWICKILINECNSALNKNKKVVLMEEVLPQRLHSSNDFLKIELNDALRSINKDYRLALVLYYIVGLNTKEIGEFTGEPEGTIKSRLSRAKAILREKYYKGEGVVECGE